MGIPSGPELLLVIFVLVLLFGAKKIPELASGLGKGIREFKKATREAVEDEEPKKIEEGEKKEAN
ncbi:MAG: twin-arginine translocase TatA/TatE family subunit [Calditrichaeota bacterium]|nr:twin-arginine translocase TatA/TatE family subunit [Calditrichota bacterium]